MKYLIFDPSKTCTGWAVMTASTQVPDGTVDDAGTIEPDGTTRDETWESYRRQVIDLIAGAGARRIVLELPSEQRQGLRDYARQSPMTGPQYGMAVGIVWTIAAGAVDLSRVAKVGPPIELLTVATNEWSATLGKGKVYSPKRGAMVSDHKKGRRVEAVKYFYGLDLLESFSATKAGNVADAILLGRWAIQRKQWEQVA